MTEIGRDFDEERKERKTRPDTFLLGGELFQFKTGLRPETFNEITQEWRETTPATPSVELLAIIDTTICNFLDGDDQIARWRTLREREEDAVTSYDMGQVLIWLIEQQTGRPTEAPSSSGNGRKESGTRSTGRSSSPRVVSAD
jgi:hypothetical protein